MSSFLRQIYRNPFRQDPQISGERKDAIDVAKARSALIVFVFILSFCAIAIRVFELAYIRPILRPAKIDASYENVKDEKAVPRGRIFDSTGMLLAGNIYVTSLYADPHFIEKKAAALSTLKEILPEDDFSDALSSGKRFVKLKDNLTPQEQEAVLDAGLPGLIFREETRRIYPQGEILAHMLGFTGKDGDGLEGIERAFDLELAAGKDVRLSFDSRVQHAAHEAIKKQYHLFQAKSAAAMVVDVRTGAILAASTLPAYDPNRFSASTAEQRFNPLTQAVYEMGSTFKIFSTAATLESQNHDLTKTYDATKPLKRGRYEINDYHAEDRILTIPEIFSHSSNIGSALMAEEIGTEVLTKFYKDLGFFDRLEASGILSAAPLVPDPWREINTLTASYGHGIAVTPLHVIQAVLAIANDGIHTPLSLLKHNSASEHIRILSEETSLQMRALMRLVVSHGTASKAEIKGYGLGGKTGTAEKNIGGRYQKDKVLSSFIGIFPSDAPRYLVFTMLDEPKGHKGSFGYATAGWTAVPAAADIVRSMTRIYALPPSYDDARDNALIGDLIPLLKENENDN